MWLAMTDLVPSPWVRDSLLMQAFNHSLELAYLSGKGTGPRSGATGDLVFFMLSSIPL